MDRHSLAHGQALTEGNHGQALARPTKHGQALVPIICTTARKDADFLRAGETIHRLVPGFWPGNARSSL